MPYDEIVTTPFTGYVDPETVEPSGPWVVINTPIASEITEIMFLAGLQGIPGPAGATVLVRTAGLIMSGHRMVVLDMDERAYYADCTNPDHAHRVIGMTRGAALEDAAVIIQTGGELTEPSWDWSMSFPVWLSTDGLLTQVIPTTGFSLIIGFPLTPTKIFIDLREPLILI